MKKNLQSVLYSLCDPFAKVHKLQELYDYYICITLLNKGLNVVSSNYWSSTTNVSNPNNAWNVNFNNGNDNWNNKNNSKYVRCVRDGE